jgi:hypothetical protein
VTRAVARRPKVQAEIVISVARSPQRCHSYHETDSTNAMFTLINHMTTNNLE